MKSRYLALISALTLVAPLANAALSISSAVGGAPTGVSKVNFDLLNLGAQAGTAAPTVCGPAGSVTVTTTGNASVVQGSTADYAAPFLTGLNGSGFGVGPCTDQPVGPDATRYLQTGTVAGGGSVTVRFAADQQYFGVLWGSVDGLPDALFDNKLEFFNAADQLVGTVLGSDVLNVSTGNQGPDGTVYVNVESTVPFRYVRMTSNGETFEFDNVAFNPVIPCSGCTYTQGWYKNHTNWPALPAGGLFLGLVEQYSKAELLSILETPVKGNGLISLAHQLITAKLNVLRGACVPVAVATAIAQADILIGNRVVPPVGSGSLSPDATSALTATLDQYNNGLAPGGPAHCD